MCLIVVVVVLTAGHRVDEEDNIPDVDIRDVHFRNEFASFVRVSANLSGPFL